MLLAELPAHLDGELTYPVDLETVLDRMGDLQVEGPDGTAAAETIASILAPLGTDTFESPAMLYETIYGNVSDAHIGRKYYDDRGGNVPGIVDSRRDEEDLSF